MMMWCDSIAIRYIFVEDPLNFFGMSSFLFILHKRIKLKVLVVIKFHNDDDIDNNEGAMMMK